MKKFWDKLSSLARPVRSVLIFVLSLVPTLHIVSYYDISFSPVLIFVILFGVGLLSDLLTTLLLPGNAALQTATIVWSLIIYFRHNFLTIWPPLYWTAIVLGSLSAIYLIAGYVVMLREMFRK